MVSPLNLTFCHPERETFIGNKVTPNYFKCSRADPILLGMGVKKQVHQVYDPESLCNIFRQIIEIIGYFYFYLSKPMVIRCSLFVHIEPALQQASRFPMNHFLTGMTFSMRRTIEPLPRIYWLYASLNSILYSLTRSDHDVKVFLSRIEKGSFTEQQYFDKLTQCCIKISSVTSRHSRAGGNLCGSQDWIPACGGNDRIRQTMRTREQAPVAPLSLCSWTVSGKQVPVLCNVRITDRIRRFRMDTKWRKYYLPSSKTYPGIFAEDYQEANSERFWNWSPRQGSWNRWLHIHAAVRDL